MRALARVALLAAFAVSLWGYVWSLDRYPAYLDFDSATLGIFVNNVSYQDHYDHHFGGAADFRDRYRARWAAQFLPAATALGALQRALEIPPARVGDMLEVVAIVLALLGLACVGVLVAREGDREGALFVLGLTSVLPPFLLIVRTTQPHFLFSFFMFWLVVYAIDRYLDRFSAAALAGLSVSLGLYLLLPYAPLAVLPVVGMVLAAGRGELRRVCRDPRFYVAAAASAVMVFAAQVAVAASQGTTWSAWWMRASSFVAARSKHPWPGPNADLDVLAGKVTKLVHQHFYFQWDQLGDRNRDDRLWTLPEPHLLWLLLVPVVLLGAWKAWQARDRTGGVFAAVLLPTYALALTVGQPEGRYMLPAVPALAYFALGGLRALAGRGAGATLLLAVVLAATALHSGSLVRGTYSERTMKRWNEMAGLRETVDFVQREYSPELARSRSLYLHWPSMGYETWLYAQMLGNLEVRPFPKSVNLAALAPGEPLFAVVESGSEDGPANARAWTRRGFQEAGRVVDAPSGREFTVLVLLP